ncbi:MAG: hypothetical protein EHM33_01925 [Chloroflexi bacterium]|nr:MAG: hypothetical protein EHM33_01925 [Chloroflexota bacterium]
MKIVIPPSFNGEKFAKKFNLNPENYGDFHVEVGNVLVCPSLPDLTEEDLADCVGPSELKPTLDEFVEAFAESEKGSKQKMKDLLERFERTKKKVR